MPRDSEILNKNIRFFDMLSSGYDSLWLKFLMRLFHAQILKEIPNKKIKILDVSCGSGELLKEIHERAPQTELYGIDISSKMLTVARKKLSKEIPLRKMEAHNLKFPTNCFDIVVNTEAFHHYHKQFIALKEMIRVARRKGKVIIADINFLFDFVHRLFEKIEPGNVKVNNEKEFIELFKKAGLNNIKQQRRFFSIITKGVK